MGPQEDQSESGRSRGLVAAPSEGPETPRLRGSEAPSRISSPQIPKPGGQADGPEFDFADPAVAAAEGPLRAAAAELEESLRGSLEVGAGEGEAGYTALREALEACLPAFYARYDDYVGAVLRTGTSKVTCSRGCGHCCSHYVSSVEPFELVFLHGRIRRHPSYPSKLVSFHRRAALFNSLLDGRRDERSDDRALYRYYLRNTPCPFLSPSGECGVYESRPMSCRMFFSQSHPSLCRGKATASPGNRNFIVDLPEDVETALSRASMLLSGLDLPESLFEGLLEANARFGPYDAGG